MAFSKISKILIFIALILSIPLIAMQFTAQVHWTLVDFILAALLLLSAALTALFIHKKHTSSKYLYWIYAILLLAFLVLWAEMAVGLFNSPISGS